MSLLEVKDVDAGYGNMQVINGVDLTVEEDEFVSIVGPNGAGKSTVMKTIFGLTDFMGGEILFRDDDIKDEPPKEISKAGIGYVPQRDNVFPSLTVYENLKMGGYLRDEIPETLFDEVYDLFPILEDRKGQRVGTMSGGQRQMVATARALMLKPELLLLDEPSAGLAPSFVDQMFEKINEINRQGTSILIVEQNAIEALKNSHRGYVLAQGENQFTDTGENLLQSEEVRQKFLGG